MNDHDDVSEITDDGQEIVNASLVQFEKTVVCPLGDDRHIIRHAFKERCFIYQFFGFQKSSFGDIQISPHTSFLADGGDGNAAEWEPRYGPIQLWTECSEDWEGKNSFGHNINSRKHWHFPFVEGGDFAWSQMAVDREGLKEMLIRGDIEGVFSVLMRWSENWDK